MRSRRQPHEKSEVELGRVITPMLDMSFQILFFFVIIYRPSALEGQMEMLLPPAATGAAPQETQQGSSHDTEIDLPAELEVIVRTPAVEREGQTPDGSIGEILVKETLGEKSLGAEPAALRAYLRQVRPTLNNQEDIKIQADGRMKYAFVIQVMDACRGAGFKNVGFKAPPDLARIIPGVQ